MRNGLQKECIMIFLKAWTWPTGTSLEHSSMKMKSSYDSLACEELLSEAEWVWFRKILSSSTEWVAIPW